MFSFVINHFDGDIGTPHLFCSTTFCAELAKLSPHVSEVIIVDGSRVEGEGLRIYCEAHGIRYFHTGRQLTFAEGYNFGASQAKYEWIILCASDIYVNVNTLQVIKDFIDTSEDKRVGCIIPTLSHSDLPWQQSTSQSSLVSCVPLMTLNMNVFRLETFNLIGGVPESFTGNYNDVEMAIRLIENGLIIVQIDAPVVHYGSLTLATGRSNTKQNVDRSEFQRIRKSYYDNGYLWSVNIEPLLTGKCIKLINTIIGFIPWPNLRRKLRNRIFLFLPIMQSL